jgi:hypothetical protein
MTPDELTQLLSQYSAGIDAELQLLHQLSAVAQAQHDVSTAGDVEAFNRSADERDRIMGNLVQLEHELRDVRATLTGHRELASRIPGFEDVARRHREAARLVNEILSTDQRSLSALADAEIARRSAVVSLERGETTLAAYRRVLSPPVASAKLVDTRG